MNLGNKWLVLITVVFGAFVSILDVTIVNTALPKMQAFFGADLHEISYVSTGYTLAQAAVIPASGFLANRYGIKKIYLGSLALFTIGSALCGLATSTAMIIAFRVLQGAGGAALFPLSFAILFSVFPPQERATANGFFGIPILVAPVIGPTLGGFLTQYVDWRWIFYVNVPIGIAGVIMGQIVLRESPPRPSLRFDLRGFLVASIGLSLLLYGLSNLAYDGWHSVSTVSGPTIVALVLLATFIPVQLRTRQPLLDLRLFKGRNFFVGNLITWFATVGLFGPAFLLPQYLQVLRGLDPYPAGLLLLTQGLGAMTGTLVSGRIFNLFGPKPSIVAGGLITVGTSLALTQWATLTSAYNILPWILLIRGLGLPLMLQSAGTTALDGIVGQALPGATTLNVVARNVVSALAVAVLTNILQTRTIVHNVALNEKFSSQDPLSVNGLTSLQNLLVTRGLSPAVAHIAALGQIAGQLARQARDLGFQEIFLYTGIVTIPVIILAFALRPSRRVPQTRNQTRSMVPAGEPA